VRPYFSDDPAMSHAFASFTPARQNILDLMNK
jgi:hypothetical protein